VTFKLTQSLAIMAFDSPYMISYLSSIVTMSLSCSVSKILSLISENLKTSRDRDHGHSRDTCKTSVQNLKSIALALPEIS